ncbi:MAG TPA: serine/threonine-protein kinase [Candidatus Obscuribacter sp.]|nr:serine/threonine-protein kinase [Candidatus Obscuribacter sp.]
MNEQSKSRLFRLEQGELSYAEEWEPLPGQYLEPGTVIDGKFRVLSLLGEGGMGAVYRVQHLMLGKDVALKTFSRSALTEENFLRFQREARALAKLNHANIVAVYDCGLSQEGIPYYTMEVLGGCSLAEKIKKDGSLAAGESVHLFQQLCRGLNLAHSKGIVHRDIKPGNIFLTTGGGADADVLSKIVDFGIMGLTDASAAGQRLTAGGAVFGSPLYMSPEQSSGAPVTVRSDVYSLGCTLFEALTGVPPFRGGSAVETIAMHRSSPLPTLRESSGGKAFPPELEQLVARMLEKAPQARPADMKEVELALRRLSLSPLLPTGSVGEVDSSAGAESPFFTPGRVCIISAIALILLSLAAALFTTSLSGGAVVREAPGVRLADTSYYDAIDPTLVKVQSQVKGLQNCFSSAEFAEFQRVVSAERYGEGVRLLQAAQNKRKFSEDSLERAEILSNLGVSYSGLGQYGRAEQNLEAAIRIFEKKYGPRCEHLAPCLMFLAACKTKQHQFAEAEKLFQQALSIGEASFGKDDLFVADCLNGLGQLYIERGAPELAEGCMRRSLSIYEGAAIPEGDVRRRAMISERRWLNGIRNR